MGYPKYSGLAELLKHDEAALDFFKGLPVEVRDRIAPTASASTPTRRCAPGPRRPPARNSA